MKHKWLRKITALLLTLALSVQLASPAFAAVVQEENGNFSIVDANGNVIDSKSQKEWEEAYPYGVFAFKETQVNLKEGSADGQEKGTLTLYRLGGTEGRAEALVTLIPAAAQIEEGRMTYANAAGTKDYQVTVENPWPCAQYQALGGTGEIIRAGGAITTVTDPADPSEESPAEEISTEESTLALHEGIISGDIVPVYCGSAAKLWGIRALLDAIEGSFPRHTAKKNETVIENGEEKPYPIDPEGECSVFVFKTVSDQFGKQTYFKVMSGTLRRDMTLKNSASGSEEKMAHFYSPCGKKQTEYEVMHAGDIGVISKLGRTATNDTLSQSGTLTFRKIDFPEPYMAKSVVASGKGDEDKVAASILKLTDEDPTLKFENNAETKQMLIYGMGDMQLDVAVSRLKSRYGVTVQTGEPEIAYRETIKKRVQVEGKHKKQSGGSGQYGHVKITFSPGEAEGLTFTQSVVGGNVPKGYYPAVEKGLLEAMQEGVLAGYPVVNLAADLYDGSYHPVDSNEISFKLAARLAYKEGLPKADPILLEPVGKLNVTVPDALVGDVIGDLNKRRGRVLGMNPAEGKSGFTVVEADVPKSEMTDYVIALRAMSQGRARFTFKVERYEEVPGNIAQKIISARAK